MCVFQELAKESSAGIMCAMAAAHPTRFLADASGAPVSEFPPTEIELGVSGKVNLAGGIMVSDLVKDMTGVSMGGAKSEGGKGSESNSLSPLDGGPLDAVIVTGEIKPFLEVGFQ